MVPSVWFLLKPVTSVQLYSEGPAGLVESWRHSSSRLCFRDRVQSAALRVVSGKGLQMGLPPSAFVPQATHPLCCLPSRRWERLLKLGRAGKRLAGFGVGRSVCGRHGWELCSSHRSVVLPSQRVGGSEEMKGAQAGPAHWSQRGWEGFYWAAWLSLRPLAGKRFPQLTSHWLTESGDCSDQWCLEFCSCQESRTAWGGQTQAGWGRWPLRCVKLIKGCRL